MNTPDRRHYHLVSHWRLAAPLDAVWDAIFHVEDWPRWWSSVERVDTLEQGDAAGLGARQRYTWKGVLPYRLRFVGRVTRVEPLRLLEGRVEGELEGVGLWSFAADDEATSIRYDWQVHTTRPWMNRLAPLAYPVFCWNHGAIMRAGCAGLARHLGARELRPLRLPAPRSEASRP